jgi:ATP-binding cassette subfamily F protein uup
VIVVSHDRYFLNRVCTAILAFEGEGVLRFQVGNYDYYLEKRSERPVAGVGDPGPRTRPPAGITDPGYKKTKPRKLKWKEERELEGMEAAILAAENEVTRIEALFAAPDFYTEHAAALSRFEAELRAARDKVARLYARWAELGEVASTSG